MQLQHARRWSKTRSALLGKWPKCSQFSGRLYVCMSAYFSNSESVFGFTCVVCTLCCHSAGRKGYFSSLIRVQQSFLSRLCVSAVFPTERRVKMCWRLRAWRPLACCRAGFSLEADRHCRAVSTRLGISLSSIIYSIVFFSFLHHHAQFSNRSYLFPSLSPPWPLM